MAENGVQALREILIVVDMQNDFVDGALGTEQAQNIVEGVVREIGRYRPEDVIATRDTHGADYAGTAEGKKLPIPHCIKGTPGWDICPPVAAALGTAAVIDKPSFGSVALAERVREMNACQPVAVTLVGLCTDICVVSNALLLKAFLPGIPVRVLASCCAGVTPDSHRAALETMKMCQVDVIGL